MFYLFTMLHSKPVMLDMNCIGLGPGCIGMCVNKPMQILCSVKYK